MSTGRERRPLSLLCNCIRTGGFFSSATIPSQPRLKIEQQGWICKWVLCDSLKLWHMVDHKCDASSRSPHGYCRKNLNLNSDGVVVQIL
ncbi:hypothetical protein OIU79_016581 [Salix purpurea]|uniref:Uncharacterized protein n=1 Tax=Salix purpurea TaxID=77065 RepID=A0A9Q0PER5_SALPP|nr:hypothetical protein OIU79_016581 [Salix purpurea]